MPCCWCCFCPTLQEYGFDAFREQEEVDEFLFRLHLAAYARQRPPGILFVETFRACSVHAYDCDRHCPALKQGQMLYNFSGRFTALHWPTVGRPWHSTQTPSTFKAALTTPEKAAHNDGMRVMLAGTSGCRRRVCKC